MDTMKRQEDMTPEDEPLRSEGVQYATGEERRVITNSSSENEAAGPKRELLSQHSATVAAAKSLQSCPTLCDPTDGILPAASSCKAPLCISPQSPGLSWVTLALFP